MRQQIPKLLRPARNGKSVLTWKIESCIQIYFCICESWVFDVCSRHLLKLPV